LTSELHDNCMRDKSIATDAGFPYWVDAEKRVTPQMFLDKAGGGAADTKANRLRWMLKDTMGADGAFDRRRQELALVGKCAVSEVSDDAVVASYCDEVDPRQGADNWMLQFLQQGKLAYAFGPSLFVHGTVSADIAGRVPGRKSTVNTVAKWVKLLNAWKAQQLDDFVKDPYSGKNARDRAGGGLMDYGVPGGNGGATVIYGSFLKNGNAVHLSKKLQTFLLSSGIKNVVAGHQPHGDCPCVIRSGHVTVITADTSYSQMGAKSWWGVDNRGPEAVSEVLLYADGSSEVHGLLADGTPIGYKLGGRGGDEFVGRQLSNGSWVKAKTLTHSADPEYLICLGEGFKLTVSRRTRTEMRMMRGDEFMQNVEVAQPPAADVPWALIVAGLVAAAAVAYAKSPWAREQMEPIVQLFRNV
jgi:hypothetical protein